MALRCAWVAVVAAIAPVFNPKPVTLLREVEIDDGAGGVVDSPEIRDFYKRHKEVTKVDADYWGSPFYYSMLQMLTQSIEAVGTTDRQAIADHFRNRKFKTLVGEVELPGQILDKVYTVGQWHSGWFHAVGGVNYPDTDYVPAKLKTGWA